MSHTPAPPPDAKDELLDEGLKETFPASDPVQAPQAEKLPPAHPPGSDVQDQ